MISPSLGVSQWWNGSDDYGDGVSWRERRVSLGGTAATGVTVVEQHVDHGDDGGVCGWGTVNVVVIKTLSIRVGPCWWG